MPLDLKSLVAKLDRDSRKILEQAAATCMSQTHFDVEPEHLLFSLMRSKDQVVTALLQRYGIAQAQVLEQLEKAMAGFKRGNSRTPAFSPRVPEMLEAALLMSLGTLETASISVPTLLLASLERDPLRAVVLESVPALTALKAAEAVSLLPELVRVTAPRLAPAPTAPTVGAPAQPGAADRGALAQYTTDLTDLARSGRLDPVMGRDAEVRQIIDVMMRRRQNNPILVGDPGVGKTAIVEGLALRIAAGQVPPPLRGMAVRMLDLGLLQAGAGVKGEFEERLKNVIAEVRGASQPTVVFIDEAHTMIGAGGTAGQNDAANLLKPALARGEFRTIAATTWSEYKRYFEKDPALARRFQAIKVAEPDHDAACAMLRGLAGKLGEHHGVRLRDDAITAAVSLSARYIPGRQLPDKAISVLDTACARVAIGRSVAPEAVARFDRELEALTLEEQLLTREAGGGDPVRLVVIAARRAELGQEKERQEARWRRELALVTQLDQCLADDGPQDQIRRLEADLVALQGDEPLVSWCVDRGVVASVISEWTGVPLGAMSRDDAGVVARLQGALGDRVVGQPQAITAIARAVRAYRAGLSDPSRPMGVFLLCGPSGVGKTETAAALAELLFGGSASLITINMSEYQEAHSVAKLKGSPPGYVGFGTGGVLTEAVRRRPYSVVLLDEVEKAHPDVLDMFYQVFDKAHLEDSEGIDVDFRNTVILLTGNLADEEICAVAGHAREAATDAAELLEIVAEAIAPALRRRFKPALLGRLTVVPYLPLDEADLRTIVAMRCDRIAGHFADGQRRLDFTQAAHDEIVRRVFQSDGGARVIDHVLNGTVVPELASLVLDALADGGTIGPVTVDVDDNGRLACRRLG